MGCAHNMRCGRSGGQLLGKGSTKPEVSCALTESAIGTSVKVKYDFYKVGPSVSVPRGFPWKCIAQMRVQFPSCVGLQLW